MLNVNKLMKCWNSPPLKQRWLQQQVDQQVAQAEKDMAYLLAETPYYEVDFVEITPNSHSPLCTILQKNGLKTQQWNPALVDLSTPEGYQKAEDELIKLHPKHLWFTTPFGPSSVTGLTTKQQSTYIENILKLIHPPTNILASSKYTLKRGRQHKMLI